MFLVLLWGNQHSLKCIWSASTNTSNHWRGINFKLFHLNFGNFLNCFGNKELNFPTELYECGPQGPHLSVYGVFLFCFFKLDLTADTNEILHEATLSCGKWEGIEKKSSMVASGEYPQNLLIVHVFSCILAAAMCKNVGSSVRKVFILLPGTGGHIWSAVCRGPCYRKGLVCCSEYLMWLLRWWGWPTWLRRGCSAFTREEKEDLADVCSDLMGAAKTERDSSEMHSRKTRGSRQIKAWGVLVGYKENPPYHEGCPALEWVDQTGQLKDKFLHTS